jgi:glucosamine--fructose-6-phosphate aminotransferase (isomerizing)
MGVRPLPDEPEPGAQLLAEIREQPRALSGLLAHEPEIARIAAMARERGPAFVRMVGHGSSDNAAAYGVYAFGLLPRWTAIRDSITLTVHYGSDLDMTGSTVVALSQSGRTPDVVEYVRVARRGGAFTIGITNETESDLAREAEALIPLGAKREQAIAATKTYTNQLAALALLAAYAAGEGPRMSERIRLTADQIEELIPAVERRLPALIEAVSYVSRMFVIGRGVGFGTAREVALKLLETCRVAAEPLTATSFAHGPVAALDAQFPVWAIASGDETLSAVLEAAARVRAAGATLIATGSAAERIPDAEFRLPTPEPPSPILAPLLSVVPGQLFAWALARAKGLDPDRPRGLTKVTLAK